MRCHMEMELRRGQERHVLIFQLAIHLQVKMFMKCRDYLTAASMDMHLFTHNQEVCACTSV